MYSKEARKVSDTPSVNTVPAVATVQPPHKIQKRNKSVEEDIKVLNNMAGTMEIMANAMSGKDRPTRVEELKNNFKLWTELLLTKLEKMQSDDARGRRCGSSFDEKKELKN